MAVSFDANALERRYAFLDGVPEALLPDVVALASGTLVDRVAGLRRWREALLKGELPSDAGWPPPEIGAPVRKAIEQLGLVRFLRDQPELVDTLLVDLLGGLSRQATVIAEEVTRRLREMEQLERRRRTAEEDTAARSKRRKPRAVVLDDALMKLLLEQAEKEAADRPRDPDGPVIAAWGERARLWNEIADVFDDLGELLGRGWDLSRGILRQAGWLEVLRLRELLKSLPELREIVRTLGRLQLSANGESVGDRIMGPVLRVEDELREMRTPRAPMEARGIERSGEVARMLPAEAAFLGHPRLRLLWHARRAERTLLTYRVEGVVVERVAVEREAQEEVDGRRPRPVRGPIIAVVDTSGSMHGLPEHVAKALVLEALRTAHSERRQCLVYSFSGPDQIAEHDLSLTSDGLAQLLQFLGITFSGGTDPAAVVARVVDRLGGAEWVRADVVVVSDGEFPVPPSLKELVAGVRERGTRFHGVQIGSLGSTGLAELCEPVHVFTEWSALAR